MSMDDETTINNDILFPAVTDDYRLSKHKRHGYRIVANRRIKKGEPIMKESIEFLFSDVQDGDRMYLSSRDEANELATKHEDEELLPTHIPVTREMLLRTHGVPYVVGKSPDRIVVRRRLESPGMFMNHSCAPSVLQSQSATGEDTAARDIEVGEELTCDYACFFYGPTPFDKCWCGAVNCRRGSVGGFKSLSDSEKARLMPHVSEAVKTMYFLDLGREGPKIEYDDHFVPRSHPSVIDSGRATQTPVMRLEFPGPSSSLANVMVRKCENDENTGAKESIHEYALHATKDFAKGELLYDFWWIDWPQGGKATIDLVFPSQLLEGDLEEGTVIRFDPCNSGAYRDSQGFLAFSGWDLLATHSCDANAVYRNKESYEDEDWQAVFAAKDIRKGDRITKDWNCFIWDRSKSDNTACQCGASNCTGTLQGFKHLSPDAKNKRFLMTWLRDAAKGRRARGKALSPYVRAKWEKGE